MTQTRLGTTPVNDDTIANHPAGTCARRSLLELPLLIVVAVMWLPYLTSSLWLDESGTYWVVKDGFADAIQRSHFQGQSPLYYVVAWVTRILGGSAEWTLRLPSLLAAVGALVLVFRIGKRLFDRESGWLGALVLAMTPAIALAAVDARPYAMGLAVFLASTLLLVRWLGGGATSDGVAYVLLTALSIGIAYSLAIGLFVHAAFVVVARRRGTPVTRGRLSVASGALLVLIAPMIPQVIALTRQSDILLWVPFAPSVSDLVETFGEWPFLAIVVGGLALTWFWRRKGATWSPALMSHLPEVASWAIVPPLLLFVLAGFVAPKFFQHRYMIVAFPGIALLMGWFIRRMEPRQVQTAVVIALLAFSFVTYRGTDRREQDWRAAAAVVNDLVDDPSTPLLFSGGFSARPQRLDRERAGLLAAPLSRYPMVGDLVLLPFNLEKGGEGAMEDIVRRKILTKPRFLLVVGFETGPLRRWLEDRLSPEGFQPRTVFRQKQLRVTLFEL